MHQILWSPDFRLGGGYGCRQTDFYNLVVFSPFHTIPIVTGEKKIFSKLLKNKLKGLRSILFYACVPSTMITGYLV